MKKIKTVGIAGAGTMGSALVQKFAQENFQVTLYDIAKEGLEKGMNNIRQTLNEGKEKNVFTDEQITKILSNITTTTNIRDLSTCDLIIEAVFENFKVKSELFQKLSEIVPPHTILATNTSSFSVSELSNYVSHPKRFIGLHYFYHAAKNRLVEIVPGKNTSEETIKTAYYFSLQTGKDPIFTKDAYGFAVNRFFVPWLNESVKILQDNIATTGEIDKIAMDVFGIGMGPFALMNATGVPVAYHAQKTLETFGNSYTVANLLKEQTDKKQNWTIDVPANIDKHKFNIVSDRLLGCVFFVCAQILKENVCSPTDLNKGARIGLKWKKGPIEMMKEYGKKKVNTLIKQYADLYNEPFISIEEENLNLQFVTKKIIRNTGYIIFNRPEDLNALNEQVFQQLENVIDELNRNNSIQNIIVSSTGKAFVAGADIKFFIQNIESNNVDKIVSFTEYAQNVLNKLDTSPKKVIAVLNGLTLGGGLELALCADEIYALPTVNMAFPETGIGIYPGLGGTQRTQKRIGKELTKYLIFTGKNLSAQEANEINLIDNIISFEDYINILEGNFSVLQKPSEKHLPQKWQNIIHAFKHININQLHADNELEKRIITKAPLAIRYANILIDEAKGPSSELLYLKNIFTTEDALMGLKNIGKKVQYKGK
ncbi:MAG: 3-hydroxyacyl-CoA dehydrogenase/enoyl-CoA hydratase family protein [Bacteroidia bacterium]